MNIWRHSTNPDIQEQHNPCFCPKTVQIDIRPENKYFNGKRKIFHGMSKIMPRG